MKRDTNKNTAVVIGGSIAGLLAARVLSDHYGKVTILERDDLTDEGTHRRGVPHARHAHALLAGGQAAVERLFPGIADELVESGAIPADPLRDGTWFFEGAALFKQATGYSGLLLGRPLLESVIRSRIRANRKIEIRPDRSVRELVIGDDNQTVVGVRTADETIAAGLVVDATGRGSKSPQWLESLGFGAPREEAVEVRLAYTTRIFDAGSTDLPSDKFVVVAPTPDGKRGGVLGIQEGNKFICTLFGHFGNAAPGDLEGFVEYARSLPSPLIFNAIRSAKQIGDAVTFTFPASRRRRYEELRSFPKAYLVFGDAICSFNPIYGQGMSSAALQSEALAEALAAGTQDLARRFFKMAAKVVDNPWNIAVGADLKMPETVGERSSATNAINWYISQVHRHAHTDPVASLAFNRVAQLLDPPTALMRPAMLARVLAGAVKRQIARRTRPSKDLLRAVGPAAD